MDKLLVVVPCLNEEANLERVASFVLSELDGLGEGRGRLVIADGGSTDGTVQIAGAIAGRDHRVEWIHNPQRIQSAAINLSVRRCSGDATILIRLDAHADYPAGFLRGLLEVRERTGADSVVVPMITAGKPCFQRAVAAAQNSVLGNGGSPHRMGGVSGWVDHGHHALMTIEAFRQVQGYDETFSHNEDAELDTRLTRAGRRIWLAGDLAITYYPRERPWPLFQQYMRYGLGRARTMAKHRVRPRLRQGLPMLPLPSLVLALIPVPGAELPAVTWLMMNLALGLAVGWRSGDRCALMSGLPAVIMQLGWSIGFWRGIADICIRFVKSGVNRKMLRS